MSEEESILSATAEKTEETVAPETEATPGWLLSEGVNGEGDAPDWFKSSKYDSVAEQAKAYAGLESKLGSFTGAPKDGYVVELDESLGYTIPEDDPLLGEFGEWAKDAGLSQDAHNKLLNMYANHTVGQMESINVDDEINKIGKDAERRIKEVTHWGQANLDANEYAVLQTMATTADGFHLLEKLKGMSRETQISAPDTVKPVDSMTENKLYEMISDSRYASNPDYRAEVEGKFRDFYGSAPANTIKQ
jgi:hypothetical protein